MATRRTPNSTGRQLSTGEAATHSTDPSFPSDHATMAGAVTVGLFLGNRRLGATPHRGTRHMDHEVRLPY
jgi:membrane-associated phospholipid phosphatase